METLKPGQLNDAFQVYWRDMRTCRRYRAYWALLHVTICLPDICAALESESGRAKRKKYESWCERYLKHPKLSGAERYDMRCIVFHEGRTVTEEQGRYEMYSFRQPTDAGQADHMRVDGNTLHVDVDRLSQEVQNGVGRWIKEMEAESSGHRGQYVAANLSSLVRVEPTRVPTGPASSSALPASQIFYRTTS
jgi:hypothetical protein